MSCAAARTALTEDDSAPRALVVVDEGVAGRELRESLLEHLGEGSARYSSSPPRSPTPGSST